MSMINVRPAYNNIDNALDSLNFRSLFYLFISLLQRTPRELQEISFLPCGEGTTKRVYYRGLLPSIAGNKTNRSLTIFSKSWFRAWTKQKGSKKFCRLEPENRRHFVTNKERTKRNFIFAVYVNVTTGLYPPAVSAYSHQTAATAHGVILLRICINKWMLQANV